MNRQYIVSMVFASTSLVFSLLATALAGTAVYLTPALEVAGPHLDVVGIRAEMAIESLWAAHRDALDSGGVEADLDGNASALFASDWDTTNLDIPLV